MSTATSPAGVAAPVEGSDKKALRADAQRNRDALLEASAAAFTEHGTDASLEDIAKRAGVGIGTLYRHFPTRLALVEATYRRGVTGICDEADHLLATHPPALALELWMANFVGYVATKRGLAGTLKEATDRNEELFAYVRERIRSSLTKLVDAATEAGEIRSGVIPEDLLRGLGGLCMVNDTPDWQAQSLRLVGLMMDGLRYGAPNSR
jgi:AcrR family transcriptional regulator